ncbi:5'/3'-nucleotidase SurE [Natronospira bacteriovora]|uniref:5'-nucleotidase SurE n=1 Tax=Natronospira bacteriovora TaxID=3069753 RepID=A0ABU0W2S4_9GAMM|nr:5'/3'-nucleotidase SurE [Natronospira sp. AB-CW4]MDQ2068315.1 5'/3'-nucleotidase SurE [Natronospira sp. AB-CW4]
MQILVSNDDGYLATGIRVLAAELATIARVVVFAPDRNRSGASNSLTLDRPLRIHETGPGVFCVEGTPTDSVHVAITGLLDKQPDMVVSGINEGGNLGDDVLYSGTVSAAMEGRFLGLPAIAVSLVINGGGHYETAARVVLELIARMKRDPLPADTILNVNVPDLPYDALRGFEATRLGHRKRAEAVVRDTDPRGRTVYWIGPAGGEEDAGPGTDFHAVRSGAVSVTPLQVDLTRYSAIDQIAGWLNKGEIAQ